MTTRAFRVLAASGVVWLLAASGGCASGALKQARTADELREHDVAVAQYMRAVRQDPDSREAALGLERAKLRAAEAHLVRGQRLHAQGRDEDALLELQLANELNPTSGDIERALRAVRIALREKLAAPPEGQTALETLLAAMRDAAPAGHQVPDVKLPDQIAASRTMTSRDAYLLIGQLAGLSVTFDAAFLDGPAQLGTLNNMSARQALDAIAQSSATFYRVTGPATIFVINDTPAKRREYQEEVVRTFYIQNADPKETADALRIAGDVRSIAPISGTNAVVIRDAEDRMAMVGRILSAFDKAAPEVVVDVEVLEVNRTQLKEYGLHFASPGSTGIDGSVQLNRESLTLDSLRTLSTADFVSTGIPALFYRLLRTDGNTRTLANPHLRMIDGIPATAKFGDDIPIPRTVIAPVFQGGANLQPQTTFEFRTVGVNIGITTRTHANDDVTLVLSIELSNLSGTGFDGLPTIGSRNVQTRIRLRDGETNILAGLIRDDDRTERLSIPGLGRVPVLGTMLFARNKKTAAQTDVVIMITPHIIRPLTISADDLRPVRVPREGSSESLMRGAPTVPPPPIIRDGGAAPVLREPAAGAELPSLPVVSGVPAGRPVFPIAPPPSAIVRKR
jgi:general secretion pathway protein D